MIGLVGACCAAEPLQWDRSRFALVRTPQSGSPAAKARLAGWSLGVTGVHRIEHDLIGSINTGVPTSDYALGYVVDPGERFAESEDDRVLPVYSRLPSSFGNDRYLLTNPAGHYSRHRGVEVTVERMMASGWRTRFDGTAFGASALGVNRGFGALEADTGAVGELFENPNARTYAWGHTFFDPARERHEVVERLRGTATICVQRRRALSGRSAVFAARPRSGPDPGTRGDSGVSTRPHAVHLHADARCARAEIAVHRSHQARRPLWKCSIC